MLGFQSLFTIAYEPFHSSDRAQIAVIEKTSAFCLTRDAFCSWVIWTLPQRVYWDR